MPDFGLIERILERARWAPSGDNTQPWRFEILAEHHLLVHGFDTRDHVVYDLDGRPSQLAVGALLETIAIAASAEGYSCDIERRPGTPEAHLLIDIRLVRDEHLPADVLAPFIEKRVVQRRAMSTRRLSAAQKQSLAASLPDGFGVVWFETWPERYRMARLMFDNARIRLNIPEAYAVHKAVIEWNARFSEDKIPSRALGVDPIAERLMHWAMANWQRVEFLNRWLFGDLLPRMQMDMVPGLFCGAHLALLAPAEPTTVDDHLTAGRVLQRFWLTATRLGLLIQPEMTPLIFSRYHRQGVRFTGLSWAMECVAALRLRLAEALPAGGDGRTYFLGRLGCCAVPWARSTRRPVKALVIQ
jgi:hypothetical protein